MNEGGVVREKVRKVRSRGDWVIEGLMGIVKTLAFTLNDTGSHYRVLSREVI